ncbi:MAG: Ig-like domain-containing protein [Planctomycetota bacterium]
MRAPPALAAGGLALALALATASCDGNVACVFADGCVGGGGSDAGAEAVLPEDGEWIQDAPPSVVDVFPSGGTAASTTPVVVTFSESMNPDTVLGAVVLIPVQNGVDGQPVPGVTQALVGEGRVLVLLPSTLGVVDEYHVRIAAEAAATDLTGQELEEAPGSTLDSFSVATEDPSTPALVTTWPAGGAAGQGETGEVVVFFDRRMDAATIDGDSFDVLVNGGQPPHDPPPAALSIDLGGFPVTDARVFRWRSVDAAEVAASLGLSATVKIVLSPAGHEIQDPDGEALPATSATYTTTEIGTPLAANLLSSPSDAIGLANLTAGDPEELLVQIDLSAGAAEDKLDLFLFGKTLDEEPLLVALSRSITLAGTPPILTAYYTLADADLLRGADPIAPRFADGAVALAFRMRRVREVTPLRVLDADPAAGGIQDVILDTVPPAIEELLHSGGATDFQRSDLRDVVLSGKASELLRSVEVTTDAGSNGSLAPVVGSDEAGFFVAAPVRVGTLDGGTTAYSAVAYDAALNPSPAVTGTFTQLGLVGPGTFVAGEPLAVQAFDATTLAPLAGALVVIHGDDGDGVGYPFVASGTTGAAGEIEIASYGGGATILSVDLAGYDLFTFHGVTSNRISVPLVPVGTAPAAFVEGTTATDDDLASLTLTLVNAKAGDSRRAEAASPWFDGESCFNDPFAGQVSCPFGPEPIHTGRLGAVAWLAGSFLQLETTFSVTGLIQAFDLSLPRPPAAAGESDPVELWISHVFVDPGAPLDEVPLEIDPVQLLATATTGIDLGDLVDDPETTGAPWISVETLSPGLPGVIPVGLGVAFDQGGTTWNVRSAHPGAVGEGGTYGSRGAVDTDFFLRAEIRDSAGNRAGQRPRLSALDSLPVSHVLAPLGVPQITSPAPGGSSGPPGYGVAFDDTVADLRAESALYRVLLADQVGRRWTLWHPDIPDAAGPEIVVRVPDLAEGGGSGLADGAIAATVSAFGWPALDLSDFLWSDVLREHDLFAHSAPVTYTQP